MDVVIGNAVLIGDYELCNLILNFRKFVDHENQNNWLISLQLNYQHEIRIVNKKHPKHRQIIKLINHSFEHGIETRSNRLFKHGILMLYYLFEKFADSHVVHVIKNELNKKRMQITFEELSSVFYVYLLLLPISFATFIIELIYYQVKKH